jgi:hypothetical protein
MLFENALHFNSELHLQHTNMMEMQTCGLNDNVHAFLSNSARVSIAGLKSLY